jgi:hypothetical protein
MIGANERSRHEEAWLLLPWLANGRLAPAEREMVEEHVEKCNACERELSLQRVMCDAFTQPDRVVYAPGPSFRKLMDRIDGGESRVKPAARGRRSSTVTQLSHVSLWRPPGLAWAASFLLLVGMTGLMLNIYRGSEIVQEHQFETKTALKVPTPNILHIALDRKLTVGEEEELLRANGAGIVEGPSSTGVLGVKPFGIVDGQTSPESANNQLHALSARLRTDPRVLWIEPLEQAPNAQEP